MLSWIYSSTPAVTPESAAVKTSLDNLAATIGVLQTTFTAADPNASVVGPLKDNLTNAYDEWLTKVDQYMHARIQVEHQAKREQSAVTEAQLASTKLLSDAEWTSKRSKYLNGLSDVLGAPVAGTLDYQVQQLFWTLWDAYPIDGLVLLDNATQEATWDVNVEKRVSVSGLSPLALVNEIRAEFVSVTQAGERRAYHGFAMSCESILWAV